MDVERWTWNIAALLAGLLIGGYLALLLRGR